jgi:hypothetical protein
MVLTIGISIEGVTRHDLIKQEPSVKQKPLNTRKDGKNS